MVGGDIVEDVVCAAKSLYRKSALVVSFWFYFGGFRQCRWRRLVFLLGVGVFGKQACPLPQAWRGEAGLAGHTPFYIAWQV